MCVCVCTYVRTCTCVVHMYVEGMCVRLRCFHAGVVFARAHVRVHVYNVTRYSDKNHVCVN